MIRLENRHQFIYGNNKEEREKILKQLTDTNKITKNNNTPSVIYMKDFSLPIIENKVKIDNDNANILAREHLNFSIAYNILTTVLNQITEIEDKDLLERINILFVNKNHNKICTIQELTEELKISMDYYKDKYIEYMKTGNWNINIDELSICFIDINPLINYLKIALNNNSYFALIFDIKEEMSIHSTLAINEYIAKRINDNISIKVACNPNDWKCYYGLSGIRIDDTHDYGTIELDNSIQERIKKRKKELNYPNWF